MARLFLIRHGEPEAAWGGDCDDPGLSARGRAQAARAAEALAGKGGLAALSSPMRRCRETAAPYLSRAGIAAATARAEFGEVATAPSVSDRRGWLTEHFPWRAGLAPRRWDEVTPDLRGWRDAVLEAAVAVAEDTALFTHFIASNVIVGAAMQSPHTIVFLPDYASITELDVRGGAFTLHRLGEEMREGEVR